MKGAKGGRYGLRRIGKLKGDGTFEKFDGESLRHKTGANGNQGEIGCEIMKTEGQSRERDLYSAIRTI